MTISSLLEGIFEFFFLYLWISNQFLPDKWNLAIRKFENIVQCPFNSVLIIPIIGRSYTVAAWHLKIYLFCVFWHEGLLVTIGGNTNCGNTYMHVNMVLKSTCIGLNWCSLYCNYCVLGWGLVTTKLHV